MLEKSDFSAVSALKLLRPLGLEAGLLVPTSTGLEKSILDATDGLREYLTSIEYHDYDSQPLGREGRVQRDAFLVHSDALEKTKVSMYRPATKNGDPRIWLGVSLRSYARPLNMLAITVVNGTMYVINMSDPSVRNSLENRQSPFRKVIDRVSPPVDHIDADASFVSQRLPLAESLISDPINGTFNVLQKEISREDLFAATLSQVSDALDDCLTGQLNGLTNESLSVKRLRRTLDKYADDPQRVEMDFTAVHRILTVQVGIEELPPSDEIDSLISALQEAAQGIRAADQNIAENRILLQEQALREISDDDLKQITDAAPVLESITEGELQGQMQEDILFFSNLKEIRQQVQLPGVTKSDSIVPDEAVRVLGRSARMLIALRKSPSLLNKLHDSTTFKVAVITATLGTLIQLSVALF